MSENKKLFAKNSLSGVIQKLLIAILTFITIPVFMSLLGAELFGIFAIISTIGDLSRLTNVGFHIALIKFLSFQGKSRESSQDIIVAFVSMLAIMILMGAVLLLFNEFIILKILNVGKDYLGPSKFLFNCLVFANALLFIGMPFSAVLESLKQIYKVNIMQFVYSIIYWSLILLFVSFGGGLELVGIAILVAALVWFVFTVILSLRAWGPIDMDGFRGYYRASVRKQLGYGLKVYLSGVLGLFTEPLIKVLVSNFFGVTFVGFVDIGLRVRNQLTRILKGGLWPLFQYFSEMQDKKKAAFLVKDVQEKLIVGLIPISVILLFATNALVSFWIGENVDVITNVLLVITVGSFFGSLSVDPLGIYLGVNHPLRLFYNQIFMIIGISIPLLFFQEFFGFKAVYLGFLLSYIASFSHMMYCQRIYLNNMIFSEKSKFLKLVVYIASLVSLGLIIHFLKFSPLIILIITPPLMALFAYFLIRELKLVTKQDLYVYLDENHFITKKLDRLFK